MTKPKSQTVLKEKQMSRYPNRFTVASLVQSANCNQAGINGRWVPARPLGYCSLWSRFALAWQVFTGKADAVFWPEGQ